MLNKNWWFLLISVLLFPTVLFAKVDSILVYGHLKTDLKEPQEKLVLSFRDSMGKSYSYTKDIGSGMFEFRIPKQKSILEASLRKASSDPTSSVLHGSLNLFIAQDDIKIEGDIDELDISVVSGGKENNEYNALRQSIAPISQTIAGLYGSVLQKGPADSAASKAVYTQIAILHREETNIQKEFVHTHPESYVSLFLLFRMKNRYTTDDYAQAFEGLTDRYKATRIAKSIYSDIAKESATRKGTKAFDFERTSLEGKAFKPSDLKGRVYLLDFWGSWCAPCRASMPHLKDLYNRYKDKGFEIVGIAQEHGKTLEQSRESWKKAVNELGIQWINVLNNENKEVLDIVKLYRVTGYPTKILVDQHGKIVLRVTASATDDIDVALKKIYGF